MSASAPDPAKADLDRLLSELCDGTIGDADRSRLGRMIAADRAARRRYLEYVDLHANLGARALAIAPPALVPERASESVRKSVFHRAFRPAGFAAAAALAAAVWVGFRLAAPPVHNAPEDRTTPAASAPARLAEVAGSAELRQPGGEAVEVSAGALVKPGQIVRVVSDDGFAALDFDDGSRLELNAETQVRWAEERGGGRRLVLSAGVLRGDMTKSREGGAMVVVTAQAEVHVGGSRFVVSAPTSEATEVEAEAGSIRLVRASDGREMLIPAGHFAVSVAGTTDLEVRGVPAQLSEPRQRLKFDGARSLAFSPDGRTVTAVSARDWVVWDAAAGRPAVGPVRFSDNAERAALSGDGRRILLCGRDGRARLFDAPAGREVGGFGTGHNHNWLWALSADGSRAAAGHMVSGPPGVARVWVLPEGAGLQAARIDNPVRCIAIAPDGRRAAYGADRSKSSPQHSLAVWDAATGRRLAEFAVAESPLRVLAFSPDGRRIAGASENGALHLWDVDGQAWLGGKDASDGWTRPIRSLAFSPDGRLLAAGSADGRVRIIDAEDRREAAVLDCGKRAVSALAFSPDGRTLAVGAGGSVTLWDVPADRPAPTPL